MQKGRSLVSQDGIVFVLMPHEYQLCKVFYLAFEYKGGAVPVPFRSDAVREFVQVLRLSANNVSKYQGVVDTWDDEMRARVVTLANYVDCPHIIAMCAWKGAKILTEREHDKDRSVLSKWLSWG